ncbi:hypothetical protein Tco_1452581, partial [Tanacetum coccineum]
VPTYHQDEDDQDAKHQAIQDDNPTITKLIHIEYSLDDILKPKTPIVIEEDEKLMVEIMTKLHKVQMEDKSITPKEPVPWHLPLTCSLALAVNESTFRCPTSGVTMTDNTALLQELQAIQQQLQQQSQQLQHQSQLLQQHSQQQRKQKARILDAVENLNFRVRKTN